MKKIGFIGLGNMGKPMALNLVKKGFELRVFDIQPDPVAELVTAGACAADSVADVLTGADLIISMLPSGHHVENLYLGEQGILNNLTHQPLLIDCSTIAPDSSRKVAEAAGQKQLVMLDAPVSGGTAGATAGTLTFIVGGKPEALEQARPVLEAMGKKCFHAGQEGAGQVAKIANNMLLAIHMTGTSEALNLGIKNGLDPKVLSEIMANSSGNNWSLEFYNPYPGIMENAPSSNEYQGGFMVDLMNKDLGLAMEAALDSKSAVPLGALAKSLYEIHSKNGNGGLDFSSIIKMLG
ncbi:MAG: 3-hydroxyisobutyrate dehydrogenase [Gammaproteobacteria bacterium]|nr:MAG: 3-hydroxyisobutyrate dehydrogenase [Pseudomonadota bacterium]PIE37977.1 MAG: 3-hydroxyisobutyrate dehydrogenase [Gammaproteobacteria bacterium]